MSTVIVAPNVRDLDILSGQLARLLEARLPGASDVKVENASYPSGAGQSHETILFDAAWREGGEARKRGFVVRIKPTSFTVYPDDLFEEQYRLMAELHAQGRVRVAETIWFEADPTVLGAPFFIMEKVRGRVAVSHPPYAQQGWVVEATTAQRARMWENGVRQLAAIQLTPLASVDFLAGPAHAKSGLPQEWDKFTRFVDWVGHEAPGPVLKRAVERLQRLWPGNQPEGVVWGDARIGNLMYDENFDVVAVMDWEQPSLGGALQDLAWWITLGRQMHCDAEGRPRLSGFGDRADTIALWQEVTGKSADDLEWYEDFTNLKIACLQIRMTSMRGQTLPPNAEFAQRLKV